MSLICLHHSWNTSRETAISYLCPAHQSQNEITLSKLTPNLSLVYNLKHLKLTLILPENVHKKDQNKYAFLNKFSQSRWLAIGYVPLFFFCFVLFCVFLAFSSKSIKTQTNGGWIVSSILTEQAWLLRIYHNLPKQGRQELPGMILQSMIVTNYC